MGDLEEDIQWLAIQDKMKPGGLFEDLPWEILKMVLKHLPEREIRKTRRLSRWYEKRVTKLFSSIFVTFNIKWCKSTDQEIIRDYLGRAMLKPHNKGNSLKLQFEGKLSPIHKEIIISYEESIAALDVVVYGGEDFLIRPSIKFDLLESLSVRLRGKEEPIIQKNITETLIVKHASKLKKLFAADVSHIIDDLNVSSLPCLESLTVEMLKPRPVWSLFRASKQTITSLDIRFIDMTTKPFIFNADKNKAASIYQLPNLQNLAIVGGDSTQFLIHNASNLVSLFMLDVNLPSELPELPQLREVNSIHCENNSLMFSQCKGSLNCLVLDLKSLDDYAFAMPQLTDLYISGLDRHPNSFTSCKFLSYNYKSLEFICLQNVKSNIITLDDEVTMVKVKTIVLKSTNCYNGVVYTEEDRFRMADLCPNAEILIWNEKNNDEMKGFMLSHHRRRGFTSSWNYFLAHHLIVN